MAADGHLGYTKNGHNFASGLPIDVMIDSRVEFPAELSFLYHRGFHTRTDVARNRCVSSSFLYVSRIA